MLTSALVDVAAPPRVGAPSRSSRPSRAVRNICQMGASVRPDLWEACSSPFDATSSLDVPETPETRPETRLDVYNDQCEVRLTGDHGCPEMPIVVGALEDAFGEVWKHISPIISRHYASLRVRLGAPLPGGVVVHGPAGSGKTTLLRAVAQTVHVSEQIERSGRSPPNERSVCLGCTNGRGC
jgi:hypothetical protein